MRFSEYFGIERTDSDDWFDVLLTADTNLYVDPFLIYDDEDENWAHAHDSLTDFFGMILFLVRNAKGNEESIYWKKAKKLLLFPEPMEFCLGLSIGTNRGSGPGAKLAQPMLEGARTAVGQGIEDVAHIEEIILFREGMGLDRISDLVCNILKSYFIKYTQKVCAERGIEMRSQKVRNSSWDSTNMRWRGEGWVDLPYNPFMKCPIILCPERFLKELMSVDSQDFWDWAMKQEEAEALRIDFQFDLSRRVPAAVRARLARQHPELVHRYLEEKEGEEKKPYDIEGDPLFRVRAYETAKDLTERHPFTFVPSGPEQFSDFIKALIDCFRHAIEESDLWMHLWRDDRFVSERAVQSLFRHTAWHYCRAAGIDMTAEANAGRGPVDFKFVQNWKARALLEIKLASNTSFWSGLTKQTVQYLKSDGIMLGYFVYVVHARQHLNPELAVKVGELADEASKRFGLHIKTAQIDARPKRSASKLKEGKEETMEPRDAAMPPLEGFEESESDPL
ncbi:hypothetical protein ACH4JS_04105 [Streptomyces sp. NPDC017638]|uniref:hypothetical protein n=1 Tax=Streptomyces sp. NPDC017638 TaxID=3365004 RepID=UPI003798C188